MEYKEGAGQFRLKRAKWFITTYSKELGNTTALPGQARLDEVIGGIDQAAAAQERADKQGQAGTASRDALRTQLRMEMTVISGAAHLHSLDIPLAAMSKFRVPAANASDGTLLAAARAMASAAPDFHQMLVGEGLAEDFEGQLADAISALETALVTRDGDNLTRQGAGGELKSLLNRGTTVLRMLHAHVRKQLPTRPDLFAVWKTAIRLKPKPGVPRGSQDSPAPDAPPAATSPAAPAEPAPTQEVHSA